MKITDIVVQFLSNNFEIIMYCNAVVLSSLGFVYFLATVRNIRIKHIQKFINSTLFNFVAAGEFALIVLCGYVYWINYEKIGPPMMAEQIDISTHWVRKDLTMYYIMDNDLVSVKLNGTDKKFVYEAKDQIREYHFSPDGRQILILTDSRLVLFKTEKGVSQAVDSIQTDAAKGLKGVINKIKWSPDGKMFYYEVSKWSPISSQHHYYIYDVRKQEKIRIKSPARKIAAIFWNENGKNLYFLRHQSLDAKVHGFPFNYQVYSVSIDGKGQKLTSQFRTLTTDIPYEELRLRNIRIYTEGDRLAFKESDRKEVQWVSDRGARIGIDDENHLYYSARGWWRKRLFHITRDPLAGDIQYYQYGGGVLPIKQMIWLPGGRYVVISHSQFGILILEPATGRLGQLASSLGHTFGWFLP